MSSIQENALSILRTMNEAGIGVGETRPRREIAALTGLDEVALDQAENYLCSIRCLGGTAAGIDGKCWLTGAGMVYLQAKMADRYPLILDAERLLRYMVDTNQMGHFSREMLIEALDLNESRYEAACRRLHGYSLIHPFLHFTEREWGVISPTQKGCQAVYDDFKKPDAPTTHVTYDQRGQHVTTQYNAGGDINFSAVQNRTELISELEKFKAELAQARDAQVIDAEIVTDVDYQVTKAVQQAQKREPDKKTILDRLNEAKALLAGITAAAGLVEALAKAAEVVEKLFK